MHLGLPFYTYAPRPPLLQNVQISIHILCRLVTKNRPGIGWRRRQLRAETFSQEIKKKFATEGLRLLEEMGDMMSVI